ncbi:hypothetical protein RUM44_004637 [Polyplax serrata]|uniref:MAGUK p55 subfamily member 5 n=1 Tax=Polyplax serrata TaxID=468196 RepID=A0ABR1B3E2_POLSC
MPIWPRRRSGSSIVVVDDEPLKHSTPEEQDEALNMMMTMLDNGPHRELPVDVPDSFIAISKTPPRYPPPRAQGPPPMNGSAKPVPPPRDHIRVEKDGRLMNRLPAPQVPARTITTINNNTQREPTKQEMDSIRKFEEQIRQRREEEERIAKQNEFLKSSIRSSKKLQAVENNPPLSGVVNDAYSDEESREDAGADIVHKFIRESCRSGGSENKRKVTPQSLSQSTSYIRVAFYGELVAALQRLQHRLKENKAAGLGCLEPQLATVQAVLLSPQFGRALSVCNKVREVTLSNEKQCLPSPQSRQAQELARDCIQVLEPCSLPEAGELNQLLTSYEMEGLLSAHDTVASGDVVALETTPTDMVMSTHETHYIPGQSAGIKIVNIDKTNEPLGATVRNEGEAVIIGRIVKGGAADKSGLLHEGDEVLQVNGIDMRGKTIHDVCDILSGMIGTLTFLIIPGHTPRPIQQTNTSTVIHMKAHFDYDPEDDTYIPCKELGISFQKGDVLHVISQEDSNWWQAYREGEEDQVLAGLIPSRSFQHQRESLKQQIAGDKLSKEKNKKSSTLLCAKKHNKKKKKKAPYNAYNEGSYPIYSSTLDDYDADEILTYEEVSLYYPRANHKRPIVLIGPPNIGRHELRQRLMEDSERFAAAIPHTSRARKESEVDGQDYHFTSRAQFESDILARKFVEHGEYEKAYYGTSLDAIRTVVGSGKICVLNLHPQSLKILRSSDLKPYVVFVAPPSLEKLRQKKIRNAEAYKEDELKGIIEKAREMEDKYGHFFDMIIINNDTERTYLQLLKEINSLEREPQWVPASWVKSV